MKYYLIAGERSGDLHAANLITALKREDPQATFRAWGGDAMQGAGADLVRHYRELAFMGFWEVFKNLRTLSRFINQCQADLLAHRPDVVILVDYAGFNMRIAKFAKARGIRVFYYISPKVWAWNQKRAYKIKALVDRMFVIFPFEQDFYRQYDYTVDYVGNPLLDAIAAFSPDPDFRQAHHLDERPIIALLPGSRKQEVEKMLDVMLSVKRHFLRVPVRGGGRHQPPSGVLRRAGRAVRHYGGVRQIVRLALAGHGGAGHVGHGYPRNGPVPGAAGGVLPTFPNLLPDHQAAHQGQVHFAGQPNRRTRSSVRTHPGGTEPSGGCTPELAAIVPGGASRETQLAGYREIAQKMGTAGASATAARLMVGYLRSPAGAGA
jgi:lipid-A-disaccharide synthase